MTTTRFIEILEDAAQNIDGAEVRDDYSGRAMYGARCVAVDVDREAYGLVAAAMLAAEDDEREELVLIFARTRTDSMGRGMVAYWPEMETREARR